MKSLLVSFLKSILLVVFVHLFLILSGCGSEPKRNDTSQLKYTYAKLKLMDLDEMSNILQKHVREFKKSENSDLLKEALQICLSRPDEDAVVEKTIGLVRNPLEERNLWESVVEELVDRSLNTIKEASVSSADQVTYSIILENLISELRPEFVKQYKSPGFESRIIEKIASAEANLSNKAQSERKLNLMKGSFSASAVAKKLIDKREQYLKNEKEIAEKNNKQKNPSKDKTSDEFNDSL